MLLLSHCFQGFFPLVFRNLVIMWLAWISPGLSYWICSQLLESVGWCLLSSLESFQLLFHLLFQPHFLSPLLLGHHSAGWTHFYYPTGPWGSVYCFLVRFSLLFRLSIFCWFVLKFSYSFVISTLLVRPYFKILISVISFFNSLISIWFFFITSVSCCDCSMFCF